MTITSTIVSGCLINFSLVKIPLVVNHLAESLVLNIKVFYLNNLAVQLLQFIAIDSSKLRF